MNKKLFIIISIISIVVIGCIIGMVAYTNTPGYVMKQYVKAYKTKNYNLLKKVVYDYGLAVKYDSFDDFEETITINSYTYSKTISKDNIKNELKNITWASEYHINNNDNIDEIVVYDVNYTLKFITHFKISDPSYGEEHERTHDTIIGVAKINKKWKILGNRINSEQGIER